MKKRLQKLLLSCITLTLLLNACDIGSSSNTDRDGTTNVQPINVKNQTPKTANEKKSKVVFTKHTNKEGEKASIGSFITMHLQYKTSTDSIIFSSYAKEKPLKLKLQNTLFKGLLNQGIQQMAVGDSATFLIPADSLFKKNMPGFVKSGENIKYDVSLLKIQSVEEYMTQEKDRSSKQEEQDLRLIEAAMKKQKIAAMQQTGNGVFYTITKKGTGNLPATANTVDLLFTVKTLESNILIEQTNDQPKKLELKRQVKGLREVLRLLPKGSKAKVFIPSKMAYGNNKRGKIPENSVLYYDLELVDFQ